MNKDRIFACLNLSERARLDEVPLKAIYPDVEFIEDKHTDTQGFALIRRSKLLISFRGTQQLRDWLTDINAFHMIYPYGNPNTKIMVHRGFMMAYLSVRAQIHRFVERNKHRIKSILCTGHSLGGALGTLCAVDMQYNFDYPIECYVSGNPMVGNKHFVKSYNKRVPDTTRTAMRKDPVPYLPPEWFEKESYEGYSPCGKLVKIGPRSIFFGLWMLIKKRFRSGSILDDLFNHDIDLYRHEVNKLK